MHCVPKMSNVDILPRPSVVCIAGFGDNSRMFDALTRTDVAKRVCFIPLDLPGFGSDALDNTNLETLADFVLTKCRELEVKSLMAHSVASIIASLAAEQSNGDIQRIISLEGNLTADDAYFSGMAADFDNAIEFKEAFLQRLLGNDNDAIISGYRRRVMQANPQALWDLGCDARRFSTSHSPGDVLSRAARTFYLHNPKNCPEASIRWLANNEMKNFIMENASHWPTVDQPEVVAGLTERFIQS
jgi:pimeloyl-ACP methyl ester carboxylesterase